MARIGLRMQENWAAYPERHLRGLGQPASRELFSLQAFFPWLRGCALLAANRGGRPRLIEGHHPELPGDRDRGRRVTQLGVARPGRGGYP